MPSDRDERSLTNHRQGVYPHTPRLGLILCAPSEAVKFEISGGRYSSCSCVSFPLGTSSSSPCHCVHAFPSDLAAFNGGMTKYASRSEDHWIDVCAAHEPELVLPRQVSRQATSRNPGGLQRSWFPASLNQEDGRRSGPWVAHRDSGAALSVLSRQVL